MSKMRKKQQLKTIYIKYFCDDDDLGEAEAFYDVANNKLTFITGWFANDASYRHEYMRGLFSYIGIEVKILPEKYVGEATKLFKKDSGL